MEDDAKWKQITLAKKLPDYWALHPKTGLCTRLLGFALDYWALHPTTGLWTRQVGFAPDHWAEIGVVG